MITSQPCQLGLESGVTLGQCGGLEFYCTYIIRPLFMTYTGCGFMAVVSRPYWIRVIVTVGMPSSSVEVSGPWLGGDGQQHHCVWCCACLS